jgi:hypothetical protein
VGSISGRALDLDEPADELEGATDERLPAVVLVLAFLAADDEEGASSAFKFFPNAMIYSQG